MGCHRSHGEEQRIARKERGRHQARLGEDDPEEEHVKPGPYQVRQSIHRLGVQVNERIDDLIQEIHHSLRETKRHGLARLVPPRFILFRGPGISPGDRRVWGW